MLQVHWDELTAATQTIGQSMLLTGAHYNGLSEEHALKQGEGRGKGEGELKGRLEGAMKKKESK